MNDDMSAMNSDSDSEGALRGLLAKRKPIRSIIPSDSLGDSSAVVQGQGALASDDAELQLSGGSATGSPPNKIKAVAEMTSGPKPRVVVEISPPIDYDPSRYPLHPGTYTIKKVLMDRSANGISRYEVRYGDGYSKTITFEELMSLNNGPASLEQFELGQNSESEASEVEVDIMPPKKSRGSSRKRTTSFIDYSGLDVAAESDDAASEPPEDDESDVVNRTSEDNVEQPRRSGRVTDIKAERREQSARNRNKNFRSSRHLRARSEFASESDSASSSDLDILVSDILPARKRQKTRATDRLVLNNESTARRSDRKLVRRSMRELEEDQIERSSSASRSPNLKPVAKVSGAREVFKPLPRGGVFRARHMQSCDSCGGANNVSGFLVYCQGCSLAYHKGCLGPRGNRDHLVTKIGDEEFVLQCRRCINKARRKDRTAPDLSRCQDCHCLSESCQPFRSKKTPLQESKEREENDGVDPIIPVRSELVNNIKGLLFRCISCSRGWHFHHLPSRDQYSMDLEVNDKERAESRLQEYSKDWKCADCLKMPAKVQGIVAWRPVDPETYNPSMQVELIEEDEKEYLIKWTDFSYFQSEWKTGAWTWGVTMPGTRKSFFKKNTGPRMTTQDAIPEEFLRIDIVLDVKYSSRIDIRTEEIDRARIKEVDTALIKYKGLGYEDAVWERVPKPEDGDRWTDFVTAYNDWVLGRYTNLPKSKPLNSRLEKMRVTNFEKLEKSKQPEGLIGGELMKYQMAGMNWLFYQFYMKKNGILADEMGLGKTIQIIAFLTMLIDDWNVFPFLVVVPNSTCPNWRREIKKWAPHLRVVAYYGSAAARDLAHRYELYPEGSSSLRCHIVVTSYEAAADDGSRRFFRNVNWQGLIVDEGQRLKSDKTILHNALNSLKAPFRLLLTGTPLQNNIRELFNLMQFLDDSVNASEMEQTHADMTNEDIAKIHELIRPMILRRTKAQVLTFLPPLSQVIVPLSMTMVQQKVYKSILARNPELLRAIFAKDAIKPAERISLNNILMQLRKVLCHPFIYSQEIEERHLSTALLHRNLVEASAKLEFLELMLPKLHERGHRVLIFSQFLDMLTMVEDFLDGLQLRYQRLDGNINSLEKQKRIDEFNAPNSTLFAFLLSTRAGGVGINLATADTVIILDPDFNPHQDVQAISRAHRIGQTKKVLCYQLMTRNSAEEKIVQIGRHKMALDHVVVEQLDAEDMEEKDIASILRHGAAALFGEDAEQTIKYDDASIERLLDRSQIENTKTGADNSAESQFSFARIWANDQSGLQEDLEVAEDMAPDPSVWDKIFHERERAAAAEAARKAEAFGRGRRAKQNVDYALEDGDIDVAGTEANPDAAAATNQEANAGTAVPTSLSHDVASTGHPDGKAKTLAPKSKRPKKIAGDSDTDFMVETSDEEDGEPNEPTNIEHKVRDIIMFDMPPAVYDSGILRSPQTQGHGKPSSSATGAHEPALIPPMTVEGVQDYTEAVQQRSSQRATQSSSQGVPGPSSSRETAVIIDDDLPRVLASRPKASSKQTAARFKRVTVEPARMPPDPLDRKAVMPDGRPYPPMKQCPACLRVHPVGSCPLKLAGMENCGLCGIPHYGRARVCPHIRSETQVKLMIEALKQSAEPKHLVEAAMKYIRGVKGTLVQHKKIQREKATIEAAGGSGASTSNGPFGQLSVAPSAEGPTVEERLMAALNGQSSVVPLD